MVFFRVRLTLQALVSEKFKSESLCLDVHGQLIFRLLDFTVVATIRMTHMLRQQMFNLGSLSQPCICITVLLGN